MAATDPGTHKPSTLVSDLQVYEVSPPPPVTNWANKAVGSLTTSTDSVSSLDS